MIQIEKTTQPEKMTYFTEEGYPIRMKQKVYQTFPLNRPYTIENLWEHKENHIKGKEAASSQYIDLTSITKHAIRFSLNLVAEFRSINQLLEKARTTHLVSLIIIKQFLKNKDPDISRLNQQQRAFLVSEISSLGYKSINKFIEFTNNSALRITDGTTLFTNHFEKKKQDIEFDEDLLYYIPGALIKASELYPESQQPTFFRVFVGLFYYTASEEVKVKYDKPIQYLLDPKILWYFQHLYENLQKDNNLIIKHFESKKVLAEKVLPEMIVDTNNLNLFSQYHRDNYSEYKYCKNYLNAVCINPSIHDFFMDLYFLYEERGVDSFKIEDFLLSPLFDGIEPFPGCLPSGLDKNLIKHFLFDHTLAKFLRTCNQEIRKQIHTAIQNDPEWNPRKREDCLTIIGFRDLQEEFQRQQLENIIDNFEMPEDDDGFVMI